MKIVNVIAVIVAVLAPCLAASGQTNTTMPAAPGTNLPPVLVTPLAPTAPAAPAPEPGPPPLQEGRAVSYAPLVGPEATASNMPASEEEETDVTFNDVALTDAITPLALQAGQNI